MRLGRYEFFEPVVSVEPRRLPALIDWLLNTAWPNRQREYVVTIRGGKQLVINEAEKAQLDAVIALEQQSVELYHVCVAAGLKPNG